MDIELEFSELQAAVKMYVLENMDSFKKFESFDEDVTFSILDTAGRRVGYSDVKAMINVTIKD